MHSPVKRFPTVFTDITPRCVWRSEMPCTRELALALLKWPTQNPWEKRAIEDLPSPSQDGNARPPLQISERSFTFQSSFDVQTNGKVLYFQQPKFLEGCMQIHGSNQVKSTIKWAHGDFTLRPQRATPLWYLERQLPLGHSERATKVNLDFLKT
jgi:hypothetical protein